MVANNKASTVSVTPNNLLPRSQPFLLWEKELSQIITSLLDRYIPLVTIVGFAGSGKTTLALEVAYHLLEKGEFSGGIVWLDCHRANTWPALLETMEAVLSGSSRDSAREGMLQRPTRRESAQAYLRARACLLIFDGLEAMADDDVAIFLDRLPSPSKALVTSRKKVGLIGQERVFEVGQLNEEEAVQFFAAIVLRHGVEIAPDQAREIVQIIGRLPLNLTLVANQVAFTPLDKLKARLKRKGHEATSSPAIFQVNYGLLPVTAQQLLRRMAVFESDVDEAAIAQICQVQDWKEALTNLMRRSLIASRDNRYWLHPLIRQLAFEQLEAAAERQKIEEQAASYFLSLAQSAQRKFSTKEAPKAIALVNTERANMLAGMSWYEKHEAWDEVVAYGLALSEMFRASGNWSDRVKALERAMDAAQKTRNEHQETVILCDLGFAYQERGDYLRARSFYEQALAITRKLKDRAGEGLVLSHLANAYYDLGEAQQAIRFSQQALAIAQKIGDRTAEERALSNLGNAYSTLGEARRAIEFYKQAFTIAREIGDGAGEGYLLRNLGIMSFNLGENKQALEFSEQALAIARETGDRQSEATILMLLSLLALVQNRYDTAVHFGTQALALSKILAAPDQEGVTNWLKKLRELAPSIFQRIVQEAGVEPPTEFQARKSPADLRIQWINQGRRYEHEQNWPAAIDAYQKARALFNSAEMTEAERRQYLEISSRLAASLKQAQRWPEALALQKENFKAHQQLGDLKGQADTYMEIGHLNQLLDDYEEAWFHYLDAYRLYRRANAGRGDKLGMAAASEALGTLELIAYMLPQAIRDLEDARRFYQSLNLTGKAILVEDVLKRAQKDLQEREAVFSS